MSRPEDRRYQNLILYVGLLLSVFLTGHCVAAQEGIAGIRVHGPGTPPQLEFACCEHGLNEMQTLFAQPGVTSLIKSLHATIAVPTSDFSSQRANVVRSLNQQGVGVVGWILLDKEQGPYLSADNVSQAVARVDAFEKWTGDYGLRWVAVGLDIEPDFAPLAQLRTHRWRLIGTLLRRSLNFHRMATARKAYSNLIEHIRSHGYPVQIYQMPYLAAERSVHSSLLDRLLGTVDSDGDVDYRMLYTSFARPVGAGMIWSLGPHAQAIAIGSTDGDGTPGVASGPLNWNESSRDLIVASHFTRQIGIYDLEGCVRQHFLSRLLSFDWNQSVVIPEQSVRRAALFGFVIRSMLWIASNLVYLVAAGLLLVGWLLRRRHSGRKSKVDR
jgi:hypothetical protein